MPKMELPAMKLLWKTRDPWFLMASTPNAGQHGPLFSWHVTGKALISESLRGYGGLEHVRQITIKTRLQYPWNLWTKA